MATSPWQFTTVERQGPVAVVRFDRGEALNAFNQPLVRELTAVGQSFHTDHDCRAIVLTGTAKAFSAGADLKETFGPQSFAEQRARSMAGRHLCRAWEDAPQIVVAAIEGMAVGAGVALAIACDWRVMGRGAYLYVPEVKVGLTLQWQAIPRLLNFVNPSRAKRIVTLCEKMGADMAHDWGLVDELADDGGAVAGALKLAAAAAAMPGEIVTMSKEAINATANARNHMASFMDADVSLLCWDAEPAVQARDAFRAGRR
ncbi:MAG: enoyl-CoA hydratase/isomerase family protein [Alphaproteobacteria bacterium]|nr:enoyl-CoA hydratase/isomerase family protein [Alphaproteobacteria bacterium]MCB9928172.1 enoyl-CoA hydratase/isomerase family protein [Alphaproteobacteria bacterium]